MGNRRERRACPVLRTAAQRVHHGRHGRGGFSLVEVLIAAVILAVAITGISGSILSAMALNRVNRDTALAQQAARRVMEELSGVPFREVFACYNTDPGDDLGLTIPARGPNFTVVGLDVQAGDADGFCGRVLFPSQVAMVGAEELREDFVDAGLSMPRDLNGDGLVDALDHGDDYVLLPVRVRVEWRGISGPRQIELETMLSAR